MKNMEIDTCGIYHYLACGSLINLQGLDLSGTMKVVLKIANFILEEETGKKLLSLDYLLHAHSVFYIQFGYEEALLVKNNPIIGPKHWAG